jgi:uncharacterized protein YoaH (UPF0181 family)
MSPKRSKHIFTLGIGKERDYLVENLSTLIAAGMPIISALDAIAQEIRSRRMRALLAFIREDMVHPFGGRSRNPGSLPITPLHSFGLVKNQENSLRT